MYIGTSNIGCTIVHRYLLNYILFYFIHIYTACLFPLNTTATNNSYSTMTLPSATKAFTVTFCPTCLQTTQGYRATRPKQTIFLDTVRVTCKSRHHRHQNRSELLWKWLVKHLWIVMKAYIRAPCGPVWMARNGRGVKAYLREPCG